MAINYPGISYLKGYDPKDPLEQFAKGFGFGEGIRNEAGAKDALSAYIDSLTGPAASAAPMAGRPDALINGSAAAAEAASDPMLTAYFANTRRSESGGNDAARNPNSTATGRYQFLEGTWNDLASRFPNLGLTPDGRTDPNQQERAMKVFTQENARTLKGSGIPVNPGTLYAAHFLGPGGAAKVLTADPNAPVASMLDPSVVQANPQLGQMSVAQFQQWANEKGGNGSGGYAPPMAGGSATAQTARPPAEVLKALISNPLTREFGVQLATGKVAASEAPASVQEWKYFNALSPDEQSAYLRMKRANPYLDIGTGFVQPDPVRPGTPAGPAIAKENFQEGFDRAAGTAAGKFEGESPERQQKASAALSSLETKHGVVSSAIDKALGNAGFWTTGIVGNLANAVPGTPAYDLARTLDTIKANIGFNELQTMRDNSPTGGALGSITERELQFLQSTVASIEQAQSEPQLRENLEKLQAFFNETKGQRRAAFDQQFGASQAAPANGGVDDILKGYGL